MSRETRLAVGSGSGSSSGSIPGPSLPRLPLLLAFASIYIIWGSTYLAIKLVMDTLPPFVMVGLRFVIAGLVLLALSGLRGAARPSGRQLATAGGVGVMLLAIGTGAVVWATQYLDSGLVALIVCFEPLWLAILMMLWPGVDARPDRVTFAALGLGFAGAVILAAPAGALGNVLGSESIHLPSILVLTLGCLSWAGGSLISRRADLPEAGFTSAGMQMLSGGTVLVLFGWLRGEGSTFDPTAVTWTSVLAFLYLVVFGSLVAFSAFTWLMRNVNPTLVATHTYVNPAVAIFLGWWLASETVGPRTLVAAALILGSVVILTSREAQRSRRNRAATNRRDPSPPDSSVDPEEAVETTPSLQPGGMTPARRCAG